MKVLVYGDQLIAREKWVCILEALLGNDYELIKEGLINRSTYEKDTFIPIFKRWAPVDMIIIGLGINDLLNKRKSKDILEDLKWYKEVIEDYYMNLDNRRKYFKERLPKFLFITPIKEENISHSIMEEYKELRSIMKKSFWDVVDTNGLDDEMIAMMVKKKIEKIEEEGKY